MCKIKFFSHSIEILKRRIFSFSIFKFLDKDSTEWTLLGFCRMVLVMILCIIVTFSVIWFILGCIWVFSIRNKVQYDDQTKSNYCQSVLYKGTNVLLSIGIGGYIGAAVYTVFMVLATIGVDEEMRCEIRSLKSKPIFDDIAEKFHSYFMLQFQRRPTRNDKCTSRNLP